MSVVNATNFRKNVLKYLDNAIEANDIITVMTKNGNAVIMSEEEYNSISETAYLNSIPGLAQAIIVRMNSDDNNFVEADWKNELQD